MTARRPSRILGDLPNHPPRDEEHFRRLLHAINEDTWEDEAVDSQVLRFARDVPDETTVPVVHPALTDYGPESAADFFRQARANQQPATQGPPSPLRAGRRPRNLKVSRSGADNLLTDFPSSLRQCGASTDRPDLLKPSEAESKLLSESPNTSIGERKPWRRTTEEQLGNNENKVPLRRKGTKRARRTSSRNETNSEENPPQPHEIPRGPAPLRNMRLQRAVPVNQDDQGEESHSDRDAQGTREPAASLEASARLNIFDRPAPADLGESSMQGRLQATRGESELRCDDDLVGVNYLLPSTEDDVPSADDQSSPHQMPRTSRSRTAVGCRRSRLSSPPHTSQASGRQSLRDSAFRAVLGQDDHEFEGSDGNFASSGEELTRNHALTGLPPNTSRLAQRSLDRNAERRNNGDIMSPFLGYPAAPTWIAEQQQPFPQPPASTTPHGDPFARRQTVFRYEQVSPGSPPQDSVQRRQIVSTQRALAQELDGSEAPLTNKTFALGKTSILSTLKYGPESSAIPSQEPFVCRPRGTSRGWPDIPTEIYLEIARYLSREDALNLRLVCRDFSIAMMGAVFGSVVVPFGRAMYGINSTNWERIPPSSGSMFEKYGLAIRKFGIAFEADADLIAKAQTKTISDEQSSWWGKYSWPTPVYPRFDNLHILENLADNVSLLKSAMAHLGKIHELGLSIDSGHGWLNGPDISDMALFDARCGKRTRVFGKNLPAEDRRKQAIRLQLFQHAQARTLQECTDVLQRYNMLFTSNDVTFLRSVAIRDMESFRSIMHQLDFDAAAHVGGAIPAVNANANVAQPLHGGQQPVGGPHQPPNGGMNAGLHHLGAADPLLQAMVGQNHHNPNINSIQPQHNITAFPPAVFHNGPPAGPPAQSTVPVTNLPQQAHNGHRQSSRDRTRNQAGATKSPKQVQKMQPQFPIIMNGYNLSAEIGGWCHLIQRKIAPPKSFPLQPGSLTEAQAQWLMETVWAQRAFLSAYTTSILSNKACFAQVHSLHIARVSSGLLSSLEQKELWQGLPGLTTLTVLVSPDWRIEHITGDQSFNSNMLVSPVDASLQLSDFLRTYIAPLERLSNLTIGFVGGGEHATGIMARNQHVLPAPISSAPRMWLSNHVTEPDARTILTFNHIKHLTVQNAWFSPLMLEAFMIKSRDTSLRALTLQSVSLTATHSQRLVAPLTTATESLGPIHPPALWLHESLPTSHCWAATIDRITPGTTFLDLKYDACMVGDPYINPRPPPSFRGFVSRLVFESCGYARLSGLSMQEFNQNDLVCPNSDPMDAGLTARAAALAEKGVMLSDKNANTGADWPLLGKLTQCIHPVEQRVLEQAWDMRFGWDGDLDRWSAVEDGSFEGGTGRFSGAIAGEGGKGIGADGE